MILTVAAGFEPATSLRITDYESVCETFFIYRRFFIYKLPRANYPAEHKLGGPHIMQTSRPFPYGHSHRHYATPAIVLVVSSSTCPSGRPHTARAARHTERTCKTSSARPALPSKYVSPFALDGCLPTTRAASASTTAPATSTRSRGGRTSHSTAPRRRSAASACWTTCAHRRQLWGVYEGGCSRD